MNVQTSSAKRFTNKGVISFMLIAGMFAASFSAAVVSWNPIYAQTTAPIEEEVEDEGTEEAEDGMEEEDYLEVEGTVDSMPADGGAGTWVIDGQSYIADANTEFEAEAGAAPVQVGDCVEVEYELSGSDNLALEIEACEDESAEMEDEDETEDADTDEMDDADAGTDETGTETGTTPPAGSASNDTTNVLSRAPNLFFLPMVNS